MTPWNDSMEWIDAVRTLQISWGSMQLLDEMILRTSGFHAVHADSRREPFQEAAEFRDVPSRRRPLQMTLVPPQ